MNRKARRTLRAIFGRPTSAKLRWAEVNALLLLLGVVKSEGSGSRVRFTRDGRVLGIHQPHPHPELKKYQVEAVREFLQLIGEAPEEG
jgi:hypothetical protein